jgi:protoheme IX farnesyltransferase
MLRAKIQRIGRDYFSLIKSLQTGLLLLTGLAGYMSARCPVTTWRTLMALTGSLLLAISGSTALNMVLDRDIDARMHRTSRRPLAAGTLSVRTGLAFALTLSVLGVGWALTLSPLYGALVFVGLFVDVVVYTLWLKRRTAWSIVWGGIAGGMPVLAGRALGLGRVDWVGILLALSVLFWIPTHIMTFNMRYAEDYARAGVPTFPSVYGDERTRTVIAISSMLASLVMAAAAIGVGMTWGYLRLLVVLSAGMLALALSSMVKPSNRKNFGLFKYASLYMLTSMLMVVGGAI